MFFSQHQQFKIKIKKYTTEYKPLNSGVYEVVYHFVASMIQNLFIVIELPFDWWKSRQQQKNIPPTKNFNSKPRYI